MVIGVDLGSTTSMPVCIIGSDKLTNQGGSELILLPPNQSKTGIPSTFRSAHARDTNEWIHFFEGPFYSSKAAMAVNLYDSLRYKLTLSKAVFDEYYVLFQGTGITDMIEQIVDIANDELVKGNYPPCNKIALTYPPRTDWRLREHLEMLAECAVLSNKQNVEVVGMIEEPAAAALEYLANLPVTRTAQDHTVLVYDLGGCTFSATILTAHQNAKGIMTGYKVLEQRGLHHAGNEFTDAMLKLMLTKLRRLGAEIRSNNANRLWMAAETLKCALSEINTERVEYEHDDGSLIEITRKELEEATEYLVTKTINTAQEVYNRCPTKPTMIIMVGGQSQMPIIRTRLQKEFAGISNSNIVLFKPQLAAALGAARFGYLSEDIGGTEGELLRKAYQAYQKVFHRIENQLDTERE